MVLIEESSRLSHRQMLAILFLLFGGIHALAFSFFLIIVLAVSDGGVYYRSLDAWRTLVLLGVPALAALTSIAAGRGLLRGSAWARVAMIAGAVAALFTASVVLVVASQPQLSLNRLIVVALYFAISLTLCLYSIWLLKRGAA